MKKIVFGLIIGVTLLSLLTVPVMAGKGGKNAGCATIQDGSIVDSKGNTLSVGYDQWGYNYQAHIFNGWYWNYIRPDIPVTEGDTYLQMKWNDAWLSNKDCHGDGLLDRHYGYPGYIGSGAWLTNHMWGRDADGNKWTYFVKIVAVPEDADAESGYWYAADGTEIGPVIWGAFAIIQQVEGGEGATYVSPAGPGLGKWQ